MLRVKAPLDFIDRPIALILFLIILAVLISHVVSMFRAGKAEQSTIE